MSRSAEQRATGARQEIERRREEARRRREAQQTARREAAERADARRRRFASLVAKERARSVRRWRIAMALLVSPIVAAVGLAVTATFVDRIPAPAELTLPESTTVYFADGKTPMAKLGSGEPDPAQVRRDERRGQAVDRRGRGPDVLDQRRASTSRGVLRAAWNNVTGGDTQGASTITQQYARVAAELKGVTYSRKLREAVIAWKLADKYAKEQILEFYLNTVPFGRGAYGIEAAAQAYLGKTANTNAPAAQQVTMAEAMVLVAMVKQPEPDPDDPEGQPGYDPTRSAMALAELAGRVGLRPRRPGRDRRRSPGRRPTRWSTRHTVQAVRRRRRASPAWTSRPAWSSTTCSASCARADQFRDKPTDYIQNGGFRIVTTIDKRAQDAAEAAADIRRDTAPAVDAGPAGQLAGRPGRGRAGHRPGAGLLRRQRRHRRRLRRLVLRRGRATRRGFGAASAGLVVQGVRPGRGAAPEHLAGLASGTRPPTKEFPQQRPDQRHRRPVRSATPAPPRASPTAR